MMAEVLRLGFGGLGEAATLVLPEVATLPYVQVTAAADLRADARERFTREQEGEAFESFEELCKSPHVDAIYVATPHQLHAEHTIMALEHDKHVIVEKPMALSIADAERMNETAEKRGLKLMCGHTKSFDPPIRAMRQIIASGELGNVCMINTWNYNDFMVRPYPDAEMSVSHGVILNQGPHVVDVLRLLGGGMVRSIRAQTGRWDPTRAEGAWGGFLEFENGAFATMIFAGYGYFDTAELTWWLGEGTYPGKNQDSRRAFNRIRGERQEAVLEEVKNRSRYGGSGARGSSYDAGGEYGWGEHRDIAHTRGHQRFYGLTVVTCEKGELRQSQDGIFMYGDESIEERPVGDMLFGRQAEITELYDAVVHDKPMSHDGRWGEATLEVCLGILQSAAERREISMSHQVPVRD
jgi:predicted dehydrogenase